MKSLTFALTVFLFLGFVSCKKKNPIDPKDSPLTNNDSPKDQSTLETSCHKRSFPSAETPLLEAAYLDTIQSLFSQNQLDTKGLQFTNYTRDREVSLANPQIHLKCEQYVNGLLVFSGNINFHFNVSDHVLRFALPRVESIALDTIPVTKASVIAELFTEKIKQDPLVNFPTASKETLLKGCFEFTFGYIDLNRGVSFSTPAYVKCWRATPVGKKYPILYVEDKEAKVLYYHSGVIMN